jgi:hypothetical protein
MRSTPVNPRAARFAFHEAGHAVARASFGLAPGRVSIVEGVTPDGIEYGGIHLAAQPPLRRVFYDLRGIPRLTTRQRRRVEQEIIIGLAGAVAVDRVFRRETTNESSGGFDEQEITTLMHLFALDASRRTARYEHLSRETQRVIAEHWREVEAVAAALLERGELTRSQTRAAIDAAEDAPRFIFHYDQMQDDAAIGTDDR